MFEVKSYINEYINISKMSEKSGNTWYEFDLTQKQQSNEEVDELTLIYLSTCLKNYLNSSSGNERDESILFSIENKFLKQLPKKSIQQIIFTLIASFNAKFSIRINTGKFRLFSEWETISSKVFKISQAELILTRNDLNKIDSLKKIIESHFKRNDSFQRIKEVILNSDFFIEKKIIIEAFFDACSTKNITDSDLNEIKGLEILTKLSGKTIAPYEIAQFIFSDTKKIFSFKSEHFLTFNQFIIENEAIERIIHFSNNALALFPDFNPSLQISTISFSEEMLTSLSISEHTITEVYFFENKTRFLRFSKENTNSNKIVTYSDGSRSKLLLLFIEKLLSVTNHTINIFYSADLDFEGISFYFSFENSIKNLLNSKKVHLQPYQMSVQLIETYQIYSQKLDKKKLTLTNIDIPETHILFPLAIWIDKNKRWLEQEILFLAE